MREAENNISWVEILYELLFMGVTEDLAICFGRAMKTQSIGTMENAQLPQEKVLVTLVGS